MLFRPRHVLIYACVSFERGDTKTLEKTSTVIRKCNDSRNVSILMNDLGVMLSLKAVYERSEDCFSIANNYFERTKDHLYHAIVTFNLAALYIIQGEYQKAFQFSDLAANLCHDITMRTINDADLPMKVLKWAVDILKELGNLSKLTQFAALLWKSLSSYWQGIKLHDR